MLETPESLLRSTKGSLQERPLPLLFHALFVSKRTAGLELKRQALEKVLVFENGAPVGCSSNLVNESIGRYLVEKSVLTEAQRIKVLAASARRGVRFEKVLLDEKLVEPAVLQRHLQANLAQKFFDAFRWTDARYRLVGDVEIDPDAPRMNAPQMLFTALCTAVPTEVITELFAFPTGQRFALVHHPPLRLEDLKLAAKEARLAEALKARPSLAALVSGTELDEEAIRRRLLALLLLGWVDLAERVPERPPAPPPVAVAASAAVPAAPAAPDPYALELREESRGRRRAFALVGLGAMLIGGAAFAVARLGRPAEALPEEDERVIFEPGPRSKPSGTPLAAVQRAPLPTAPAGARPQGTRPRELMISASGIAIEAPEALPGKQHRLSADSVRLLAAGKPAQARPILERLARLEATEARIPYGLAVADFLEAKDEEARKHLAQALELAPDYAEAHLLAGYLEQLGGRAAEALAHYQAFLKTEAAGPRAEDVRTLAQRLGAAP